MGPAASGIGAKGRGEGGLGAYPLFGRWSFLFIFVSVLPAFHL
jgi:hypothetical protein